MAGYLRNEAPGVVEPPPAGWYDTGDIVSLDAEGYVTIHGRVKRFAKIGGEMVSLAAVEAYVERLWPGHGHAVVTLPDAKKGEQLVLVTDHGEAERDALIAFARSEGMAELAIPKRIHKVEAVPLLGTGKVDYGAVKALAEARWVGEEPGVEVA
jgi:acyl-[acyl-carrier-protein]-phospholipid O-acyltransferase/long-chain-fatty-acid--[acyl-carrier-protein] ligase